MIFGPSSCFRLSRSSREKAIIFYAPPVHKKSVEATGASTLELILTELILRAAQALAAVQALVARAVADDHVAAVRTRRRIRLIGDHLRE